MLYLVADRYDVCLNGNNVDCPIGIFESKELAKTELVKNGFTNTNDRFEYIDGLNRLHVAVIYSMKLNTFI